MKASKFALSCVVLLAGFASVSSAANVEKYMMLKDLPPSCDPQNPPAPVTTFLTTDTRASLWFYLTGANAGDVAATDYYTPKGDFYQPASGAWDPLSAGGNFCFTDAPFTIAGAVPGSMPGVWTVRMKYNGVQLFSLNFTIAAPGGTGTTLTVDATANIFAAGRATAFAGTLPPSFSFTPSAGSVLIFSNVNGSVNCTTGADMNGPDGSASCAGGTTNINNYQGISGIIHGGKSMFLVGVFLDDSTPADPAPARMDFTNADTFSSLSPLLRQVFFIGDGLAGTGTGAAQQFVVPAGATRLLLGFADAFAFHGDPGYYDDNSGSLTATFIVTNGQPASCSYSISPTSLSFIAGGGNSTVAVTAGTNCSWTAQSNAAWITVSSGGSGTGNGTVSYSVAANSSAASRSGTLTIGGQTFTVTQAAAASTCSYSLNPTSAAVASGGITAGVLVVTDSACPWTAASNIDWIVINSGSSGTGNGTVNYTAAANTSTGQRSGTLTIAGQTFTVNQAGASAAGSPVISANGVLNAASYMPSNLPGGAIARGSLFSIFGSGLGPAQAVQANAFPLATTLGGVGVKITQGSNSVNALPLYVTAGQINAVMPSNAPSGDVQITVTYNGNTSAPAALRIATSNFGAFNTAGGRGPGIFQNYVSAAQQPLNTRSNSAKPGQVVTLWGTGLGPISAPDNVAPPAGDVSQSVQVLVGNKSARKLYAGRAPCCSGVDQIVFTVPADAPQGCYVPVQVKVGDNSYSNAVTMAIDAKGKSCSDPANPFASAATKGGRSGSIFLIRASANVQLDPTSSPVEFTLDLGIGLFQKTQPLGDLGFNLLSSLPPVGTCSVYTNNLDLTQLLSTTNLSSDTTGLIGTELDAGPALSISGPKGGSIAMPHANDDHTTGPYVALLGGVVPSSDLPPLPPFLDGGSYQITGPGGKDVGPFSADVNLPGPVVWSNRDQITAVNRAAGVTLTWSGGDPNSELILIAGGSDDETNKAGGGFFCFAPLGPGSFTVPASILSNLPASGTDQGSNVVGVLLVGTVPGSGFPTFTATGLDSGQVFYGVLNIKTVPFQ